jgi:CubicO group peptidase (beta-lactamase class C family)
VTEVNGVCEKRFTAVRDALAASLDDQDVGACAAVFLDGEPVVDIWGGYADAARTVPWERDTITNIWSTSKTMLGLSALILADRGELDLDAPVARYWPEFAAAGKEAVLVSHLLSHTAGLPDFDEPVTAAELYDWPGITARLAAQAPRWEPGKLAGYHSMTQTYLVGEVIQRVTGRPLARFFAEEVAGPLGADFHWTLPAEHDHRLALGIAPPGAPGDWGPASASRADDHNLRIRLTDANSVAWRRSEGPVGGAYGNARSAAAIQSVLACGGTARGVRLLSPAGCERAREEQYHGVDQILGGTMRYGMGYGIFDQSAGWGGWGGSMVMADPGARMSVAYAMNQMLDAGHGDVRALGIVMAAYEGLRS